MRQAGRYLPEYRALKEHHPTKEMMQNPELACEITLQPKEVLGVDSLILYADILMLPDALGMGLDFAPGDGPVFGFAIDSVEALNKLNTTEVLSRLDFVFKAIALVLKKIPKDYPLIGFAGAPFTVASYMVCGGGRSDFSTVKKFALQEEKAFSQLMDLLTQHTIDYVLAQANAGVCAIQLFDTWAGLLSPSDYEHLAKPYSEKIFTALKKNYIPSIHYIRDAAHLTLHMAQMSADCLSLDWRVSLADAQKNWGERHAIQGNLDPAILLTTAKIIAARTQAMLRSLPDPKKGYVVNLGHGVHKDTPVKNAKVFVETAKGFFR